MTQYLVTNTITLVETWTAGNNVTDALRTHENARRLQEGVALLSDRSRAWHDGFGAMIHSGIGYSRVVGRRENVVREG